MNSPQDKSPTEHSALDALNRQFAISDHVSFRAGPGGLAVADVANEHGTAAVALSGGHVLSFQPSGHEPVLWLSRQSRFEVGTSIRGGIPVCWPWFAAHPDDPKKPFHGFARTSLWSIMDTRPVEGGATQVRLGLRDSDASRDLWPHSFELENVVTVGPELRVELVARNTGDAPWTCTAALHSYFRVSDVTQVTIHGLEGRYYVEGTPERQLQSGPVTIDREVDRVYLDTTETCTIQDPGMGRRIHVAKAGSRSTVVWNPWIDKAGRLEDFPDDEYPHMVCVETANTRHDAVTVHPGAEHRLCARISVERL